MWFCVSVPLVFLGSYLGYKRPPIDFPTKTNLIPRAIPPQPWCATPTTHNPPQRPSHPHPHPQPQPSPPTLDPHPSPPHPSHTLSPSTPTPHLPSPRPLPPLPPLPPR
eukprot:6324408-Prymnesium_polylepis.1